MEGSRLRILFIDVSLEYEWRSEVYNIRPKWTTQSSFGCEEVAEYNI